MEDLVIVALGAAAFMAYLVFKPGPRAPNVSPRTDSIEVTHIDPEIDSILEHKFKFDIINYLPSNVQNEWLSKVAELERNQLTANNALSVEQLTRIHTRWRANQWRAYFIGDPPWIRII